MPAVIREHKRAGANRDVLYSYAIRDASEAEMTATAELWWDDKLRASATALWKRWRPRTG